MLGTLLSGRVAVVTGANCGIGKEIARGLARLGARVVLACRSAARGEAALAEIAAETGSTVLELEVVDLSSQGSVRAFVARLQARFARIDVLVNNASVWPEAREVSTDGIERTWATNVLAYYLLMTLLSDRLVASGDGRIVNVASDFAGGLDLDDPELESRPWNGTTAYRQSKQAERMLSWGVAERLQGVTVNACHPGSVDTQLFRYQSGLLGLAMTGWAKVRGKTPEQGADTPLWLATSPEVGGLTGRYWVGRREVACKFRDYEATERLLALCAAQVSETA